MIRAVIIKFFFPVFLVKLQSFKIVFVKSSDLEYKHSSLDQILYNMEDEKFDYIVIGAGVNGSWTAYHLSKRGFKVLLLDQVCIHTIFMLSLK